MPDYPAAHSMDSTWYAVDADGEVAAFDTGEGGCVPEGSFPMGGEMSSAASHNLDDHELLAYALHARARHDERLRSMLPPETADLVEILGGGGGEAWDLVQPLLRSAGVWTYACDEPIATPYLRQGAVARPLRLDDFTDELKRRFDGARLPVRFRDAPVLAPGEHASVEAWGATWIDRDGRAHPTAGREDEFEKERAEIAELTDSLRLEAEPAEAFEGESFYDAVARLLESGASARSASSRRGRGPSSPGGFLGWLGRLFGRS